MVDSAKRYDFLVELGTEELPPKALRKLQDAFASGIALRLTEHELDYQALEKFATPRRLAVRITGLLACQADKKVARRGPPTKIAFDQNGNPTKAAEKFAATCGVEVAQLSTTKTDKGEWLFFAGIEKGRATETLLPGVAQQALAALPIPKRMRWGDLDLEFVRPVHWAVMLWDTKVIKTDLIGMPTDNKTFGHRFHAPGAITLNHPNEYAARLKEEGWVIADFDERKQLVCEMIDATAAKPCGGTVVADEDLLDEIAALVEWPVPVAGEYDRRFLQLPPEVLVSTLKDHQRYFPVVTQANGQGEILPWFITVSNIKSLQPDQVKKGNERVISPRLADAEFFWETDKKTSLEARISALNSVVFQKKLGSLADKVQRVKENAVFIAELLKGDSALAARAASLAKCDLLTGMVSEFPDLQGTMGRYYAVHDGESDDVAAAMQEQYLPRFAGDALPVTVTGQSLAIADKLDTIVSIFALGQKPTGTKDPFGLRRSALGVLRILIESSLELNLKTLIQHAAKRVMPIFANDKKPAYSTEAALVDTVFEYMMERLRGYFLDNKLAGFDTGMFDAVIANQPETPLDFLHRIRAVKAFMSMDESASLAAANKRIANILKAAKQDIPDAPLAAQLTEAAEINLFTQLQQVATRIAPLRESRQYQDSLSVLASLRQPVDEFFDNVMVMDDNLQLRSNRLALLANLRELFLHTADFSKIQ